MIGMLGDEEKISIAICASVDELATALMLNGYSTDQIRERLERFECSVLSDLAEFTGHVA